LGECIERLADPAAGSAFVKQVVQRLRRSTGGNRWSILNSVFQQGFFLSHGTGLPTVIRKVLFDPG
jgi:hypothetical protein